MKLTQNRLKEALEYNPETGAFTWIKTLSNCRCKGSIAGRINHHGYVQIRIDKKDYQAHRLAFLYMEGYFPEHEVDHTNRDRSDNRWVNLREVSRRCNSINCTIRDDNTSGITGVGWYKPTGKWVARIAIFSKSINLGYFESKLDAAKARWEAEKKYGFPTCNTTSSAYQYIKKYAQSKEDE